MRYFIEGSNRFYFNDELLCFEFCTVSNKYKVREVLDDGFCLCSVIDMFDKTKTNRKRKFRMSIAFAYCLYVLKYSIDSDFVIRYKDGNYHNINCDNIIIDDLSVYGDNWVSPTQFKGRYKLCSNGIVYDCEKHSLVSFRDDGSYYQLNNFFIHELVWEYFGSDSLKESMVVDHIDNNMYNNDISNLQLISQNKNIKKERNILSKKSIKVKNISITSIKDDKKKIDYSDFNSKSNYVFQNSKQTYVFNIPYNGDYYLLGSISDDILVNKVDEIIKLKKNDDNFLLWLKEFKDSDFIKYQKESEDIRHQNIRKCSKGYYYFKAKNLWKSHITYNGICHLLGYFKYEVEADCIYKEATNMIDYGIFEKWYKDIKEHQRRIKYIFES